ncbi:VOC family protein [Phormidium sp. CCY1219]|uniref:VOC family protein n=1 Tax=Phormidium sp. CCY1219 TaxID=2886104 RepID=UPI002D1E7E51|nr:VOC family protein [Phormidium sp. CCY1219]MEB3826779.1 VOC family protein [Phormidium sp. CCY1219]
MTWHYHRGFVTLSAVNFAPLLAFYTQWLGIEPHVLIPNVYAEFSLPGLTLGIFRPKASHESEFAHPGHSSMSLCFEVDNLEAAIAHLHTLGCPPPGEIFPAKHGREIYACDPAGNRLILHQSR